GGWSFSVPDSTNITGPAKKEWGVFFNPAMEMNRDLSVLSFAALSPRNNPRILEALCASGIRGLRHVREMPILIPDLQPSLTINDSNPWAVKLAAINTQNLKDGGWKGDITVSQERAQSLMQREHFDMVDVDPYGPAVPFLDSAIESTAHKGILAFTATDTAVACGSYGMACLRRYQARPLRNQLCHEAGLRLVVGHAVRRAAEIDVSLHPLMCYFSEHYFRAYFRVEKSRARAKGLLDTISMGEYDSATGEVESRAWEPGLPCTPQREKTRIFGPYWDGPLFDPASLARLTILSAHPHSVEMGGFKRLRKLVKVFNQESGLPPFFYDTNEISRLNGISAPSPDMLISILRDNGHAASRTHFSPTGVKTDAPWKDVLSASRN
ncbi:MAG: hypothetical protein QCI38_08740, partial [Candidatus Thermoplasmatota archaeon]|nr:hypothetical protein [Candidatus Thermoplasmatota archaeon]